jgi:hypothetical protein
MCSRGHESEAHRVAWGWGSSRLARGWREPGREATDSRRLETSAGWPTHTRHSPGDLEVLLVATANRPRLAKVGTVVTGAIIALMIVFVALDYGVTYWIAKRTGL